ncbi:MAG: hypothetical protein RIQ47_1692 [Bacteroidota bacterium]|jgi:hypothetical protein
MKKYMINTFLTLLISATAFGLYLREESDSREKIYSKRIHNTALNEKNSTTVSISPSYLGTCCYLDHEDMAARSKNEFFKSNRCK